MLRGYLFSITDCIVLLHNCCSCCI